MAPGAGLALCPRCLLTGGAAAGIDDHEAGAGGGGGAPSLPGLTLGEEIGRGGMGRVFRARHLRLDREVAVKLLSPELAADPLFDERFAREARLLGRLSHPHIVAVHDFGVTGGGQSYLVMELVPGGTLAERLPLPPLEAVRVALELLDGLAYAHGKGLVHRDIKPANVLFDERGGAKLADFGIARLAFADPAVGASGGRADGDALTRPSMVAGTPGYVAPEARLGAPPDPRMDVFGVGVLLHRMITGKLPAFDLPQGERPGEGSGRGLGEGLGEGPGEGPGEGRVMPAALGAVVRRATAFDPRDRPAGAAELAALLELAIAGVPDARVDRRAAGAAFSAAPTLSAGAAVGAASAAAEVVAGAAAFPAETLPPDERSWQRSVALVMAAATAVAIYALLVSVTPRVLEPGDELPLVRFGAERRPDGRLYTRARFETLPVLATAGAFAVAFAAYGLLRRHWRRAGLDLPAPHRPLASTRPLLRLALILNAIFLARTGLDRAGLGRSVTAYVPVLAGVLELVMVYRFWRAVLEARRTARPLSREPLLWLALALALVPPAVSLVRTLAGQEI